MANAVTNMIDYALPAFDTVVNKLREGAKNSWYTFSGDVCGKDVYLKGSGAWLSEYVVDGEDFSNEHTCSVRDFNKYLLAPWSSNENNS